MVVQVVGVDRDDFVAVGDFAGFAGESEVCDGRDVEVGLGGSERETVDPVIFRLVLQVESK